MRDEITQLQWLGFALTEESTAASRRYIAAARSISRW